MRLRNSLLFKAMTLLLAVAMVMPLSTGFAMMGPPDMGGGGPPDMGGSGPPDIPDKPPMDIPDKPPMDIPDKPPADIPTMPDKPPTDMPTMPTDMTKPPTGDIPNMPGGTPQMPGGTPQMPGGTPQMPGGTPQMPGGTPQMPGGTPQIPGGTPQMPSGTPQIPGGKPQMPGGMPTMPDSIKLPDGTSIPMGEFKLPEGIKPSAGLMAPQDIKFDFDPTKGQFMGTDGKAVDINKMILPDMMNNPAMKFDIPKMDNGSFIPVFIENFKTSANAPLPVPPGAQQELRQIINMDLSSNNVNKTAFTDQFRNMDISKLQNVGLDTLESLYQNVTPDKLDITNPEVQKKMDLVYQERNKALSIGDINAKLKALNQGGTDVLSVSADSLVSELASLEAMKAKGITDPAQAKKIDEAIAKTKDAQLSQTRLMAIRQQVAQLTAVKEQLVKQSEGILTGISQQGLIFTPPEKQALEAEIAASGSGTVGDQGAKILALIETYSAKMAGSATLDPVDAVKLSTLYQRANNMARAQEVLSSALAKNPNEDKVALELASLYESSNQLREAAEVLKTALNRDPLPQTQAKLAEITREMGNPAEAKTLIEKAMQGMPNADAVYTEANNIYKAAGDTKDFKTFVNGEKLAFDVPPKVENGRLLVPIGPLTTALGADVKWDSKAQKATIAEGSTKIEVTIGSKTALVNGVKKTLDAAAKMENGRVIVPAKFVGESLNQQIDYKADSKMVILTGK